MNNNTRKKIFGFMAFGMIDVHRCMVGLFIPNYGIGTLLLLDNLTLQSVGIMVIIVVGFILIYQLFDFYTDLYRQSRLATFTRTFSFLC